MKIISKFKDYYDHVAHQYGGGDPKITYHRKELAEIANTLGAQHNHSRTPVHLILNFKLPNNILLAIKHYRDIDIPKFSVLVVGDTAYGLILDSTTKKQRLITDDDLNKIFKVSFHNKLKAGCIFQKSDKITQLTRLVGHPVYLITACHTQYTGHTSQMHVTIAPECPRLAETNIPAMISAEQMYQDIAYFLGNTMNGSPDIDTPVKVSDKDRIVQHGFDLKQSFRHRKNKTVK